MEEFNIKLDVAPAEYVGEYIEMKQFKKMRFNAFSENDGTIHIEYSNDKTTVDMTSDIKLQGKKWISHALENKMPFVRVHLKIISEGKPAEVNFTGTKVAIPVSTGWLW